MKRTLCLLLALCLALLCCACTAKDPLPTPTPPPTSDHGPQTIVDVPDENTPPETMESTVNGEEVTLTEVTGSFRRTGGPDFSLFVNKTRFQVNDVDGYCYVTTDEGTAYAEIGFRPNSDADTLSGSILREYGNMQDTSEPREETLGEYATVQVAGYTMDSAFEVYLINVEGGCVTLVVCSPMGEMSGISSIASDAAQLTDALRTLKLS